MGPPEIGKLGFIETQESSSTDMTLQTPRHFKEGPQSDGTLQFTDLSH